MEKLLKVDGNDGVVEFSPIDTTTGASDAGKVIGTDSEGKLAVAFLPDGIGADTKVIVASEALSAGDFVNIFDDSGTIKVRKADATAGFTKSADGFVKAAVSLGQNATVYFDGTNSNLSGLTLGVKYYLSATAGGVVATAPTTTGYIRQPLGKAMSATELTVEISEPIKRA